MKKSRFFENSKEFPPSAILALHGFTGTGEDFEFLKSFSSGNFFWETPDLPTLSLPVLCEFLREKWDKLAGIPRVLLGYSMGGRIALHLAREISWQEEDSLVLISASPGISDEREREQRQNADAMLAKKIEASASAGKFYEEWQNHPLITTQRRLPTPWRDRLLVRRSSANRENWAEHLRLLGTGTLPSMWENLGDISAPKITLVVGDEDKKFCAIAEKMALRMPRSRLLVVPASGHSPHLETEESCRTLYLGMCGTAARSIRV